MFPNPNSLAYAEHEHVTLTRRDRLLSLRLEDMSATEEGVNPYELLNIEQDSTDQEVKTAYRQRSLKVHPDRVCFRFFVGRHHSQSKSLI